MKIRPIPAATAVWCALLSIFNATIGERITALVCAAFAAINVYMMIDNSPEENSP